MQYDVIIIGAGVAGLACAIKLRQLGKTCIVLEKTSLTDAKACGGGVTNKAIKLLVELGINIQTLFEYNARIINLSRQYMNDGTVKVYNYSELPGINYSIAMDRHIFNVVLEKQALELGVRIECNYTVKRITVNKKVYVDNYEGNELVFATGVDSTLFLHNLKYKKTVGITQNVDAVLDYPTDEYTFYFDKKYYGGYAWVFPIGVYKWNIGVWQTDGFDEIKSNFNNFFDELFRKSINKIINIDKPKSGIINCGNTSFYEKYDDNIYYVGDAAGCANIENGEGIYQALRSGIHAAKDICLKSLTTEHAD